MELFNQIFQLVLCLSILIILHEFGHFLPAKLFKTKVEKFYLFFDPWFSIYKKKIGETTYGIGWLPFGGYVKIAGMIDESMDKDQMKKPAEPWEFRSKPAWQRLIIMLGGVTVNFFLAWIIYGCLSFFNGETFHSNALMTNGIAVNKEGRMMGLENGDKILKIDGRPAERMENSMINILFANNVTVLRDGKQVTFPVNENGVAEVIKSNSAQAYYGPGFPAVVDSVVPQSGAAKAGLIKGDKIIAINGQQTPFFEEVTSHITGNKGKTINLEIDRKGQILTLPATVSADGKLGFSQNLKVAEESLVNRHYSLLQAVPRGLDRTIQALVMQVKQFKIIFNQKVKGYTKVAGPIGIVKMMPPHINWTKFWSFTAMFSIWLAFLNLIPIPGLDGGHVLFTLWEIVTGKPAPEKVLENAQMVGMVILLGLMILIFGNDIYKLIFH